MYSNPIFLRFDFINVFELLYQFKVSESVLIKITYKLIIISSYL